MQSKIQVDVWGGELHQNHVASVEFKVWADASQFVEHQIESGMLCNVLHTDFKAPSERVDEMTAAVLKGFMGGDL